MALQFRTLAAVAVSRFVPSTILYIYIMSISFVCLVPKKARRGNHNFMKLELQLVVSCCAGAGNPPGSCNSSKCSECASFGEVRIREGRCEATSIAQLAL